MPSWPADFVSALSPFTEAGVLPVTRAGGEGESLNGRGHGRHIGQNGTVPTVPASVPVRMGKHTKPLQTLAWHGWHALARFKSLAPGGKGRGLNPSSVLPSAVIQPNRISPAYPSFSGGIRSFRFFLAPN